MFQKDNNIANISALSHKQSIISGSNAGLRVEEHKIILGDEQKSFSFQFFILKWISLLHLPFLYYSQAPFKIKEKAIGASGSGAEVTLGHTHKNRLSPPDRRHSHAFLALLLAAYFVWGTFVPAAVELITALHAHHLIAITLYFLCQKRHFTAAKGIRLIISS